MGQDEGLVGYKYRAVPSDSMIEFLNHIIAVPPHPSDLGLVKPSGGFQLLPAIFGVIAIIQVSQFHWYARDKNDPSKRFQR